MIASMQLVCRVLLCSPMRFMFLHPEVPDFSLSSTFAMRTLISPPCTSSTHVFFLNHSSSFSFTKGELISPYRLCQSRPPHPISSLTFQHIYALGTEISPSWLENSCQNYSFACSPKRQASKISGPLNGNEGLRNKGEQKHQKE